MKATETKVPEDLRYTEEHEWVKVEGSRVRIGITDYAQDALTDVVYVELPEVGEEFAKGDSMGVVESTKSVSDIFAPVTGRVVEINELLNDHPELINEQPYGEGWMIVLEMTEPDEASELLDPAGYTKVTDAAH